MRTINNLLLYLNLNLLYLLLLQTSTAIQLCANPTAPYPCTSCQPYTNLNNGFCTCKSGYYMNTNDQPTQFCDLCHGSCKTCYGPTSTNCISCPDAFVFDNTTSTCKQSNSVTDEVIVQAYYIEGFTPLAGWSFNSITSTYQCGVRTLLGGTISSSTNSIQVTVGSLPNHFAIRVRANFFFLSGSGVTKNANVKIGTTTVPTAGSDTGLSFQQCSGNSYATRAVDVVILHSGASATIYFSTSVAVHFGIRDVIIIAQKCSSNCTTCTGYNATNCIICADGSRSSTILTAGTCYCSGLTYQQPYAGTCANPCPSVPVKYYGNNNTRMCETSCPNNTFSYDDQMICIDDCPVTSTKTSEKLYRDYTNWRCVTNCPTTQPYADPVDRKCYAVCPSPRYGANTTKLICVGTCPHTVIDTGIYKTYASGRYCVPYCPSTSWADPATAKCISPCTGTYLLMDNSTGQNLCVTACPPPNRFASSGSCIEICPAGQYGDITTWACTGTCTSPNWGLQSYNRKCVPMCPSGTWARTSSRTCVNTTLQCNPNYANDYARQCVASTSCPFGTWADSSTYSCVTFCPNTTYGNPNNRKCDSGCPSPYFADPGVNLCLNDCVTEGLYADVSSSRTCVAACNNLTGATPWADDSTRRCVSDCNNTVTKYLADNTTWKCVFDCPLTHVADFTTLAPKCVVTCPTGWFADSTPGSYKICVQKCPQNPPQFGDALAGNLCVNVCTAGTYGDETGNRLCAKTCPSPYYSQNDGLRRCVLKCNSSSFGYQQTCTFHTVNCPYSYKRLCYQSPQSCPPNWFGDNSTNLCANPCPAIHLTFGDPFSKFCVLQCPNNTAYPTNIYAPRTLYADISNRQCVQTCSASYSPPLFGSNSTRTCQAKCLDYNAYAQVQSTYRICVDRCWAAPAFHYANNLTKTCGLNLNCPTNYYARNSTQLCVQTCPSPQWGYRDLTRRMCLDICPPSFVGDDSSTKRVCIPLCPDIPDRYADLNLRICVDMCNSSLYGDPVSRTCKGLCDPGYYSYQPTRRCIQNCPPGYFADDTATIRKCQPSSSLCAPRFGDPFLRKCVGTCTGPTPVNTFGTGTDCVSFCPNGTYADSYSGSRLCVQYCPPGTLNSVAAPNLYGDPTTRTCVSQCITPSTWADFQTRLCQAICSPTPIPTYSQNFQFRCVTALNCPTSPTVLYGDNFTRSCVSFCSNQTFADPVYRMCVPQCLNNTQTGTSTYYGDTSSGQYRCVIICPTLPRLFGENSTNLCVPTCPALAYGDQTGNRTCVPKCPLIGATYYFAQNYTRICVLVCIDGTWGKTSSRECVEAPTQCGSQWADNTTHLCVPTCPASANLFGDPSTTLCVPICPNTSYADDLSRKCVSRCPSNNGVHDTFGNNDTWICEETCTQPNAYADPQTLNRYCVLLCSQSPLQSFADPISKSCVPRCPSTPSLFADVVSFKCVTACVSPYFADSHTRRCVSACDTLTQFKLRDPRLCVTICPSSPDLYGDPGTGFCQTSCSSGYRYGILRKCVPSCITYGQFDYNGSCVQYCPYTYYADTNGHCVNPCPLATLFGQNTTTTCRTTCITGYAYNRLCVAICPNNLYGYNNVCESSCPAGTASNVSNLCIGNCDFGSYNQNGMCVTNCTTYYADPNTRLCSSSCTMGRYADISTHKCVEVCPAGAYRDPSFICKTNCSPLRADNLTLTCTSQCSNGTWGYNYQCVSICPAGYYGYQVDRDCYNIANIPDTTLFADNVTQTWVATCTINPLKFGDTNSHQCVDACTVSNEYTDPVSRQCKTACTSANYYRDPTTKACVMICPPGLHANYLSGFCEYNCTLGLFDYTPTHICVDNCPLPYYGYDNGTELICVLVCLPTTFAEGDLCVTGCTLPLVADSVTRKCVSNCINSYVSQDAVACVTAATCALYSTIADNSTNRCVPICPTDPDYYQQNGICVGYCSGGDYADPTVGLRVCTSLCQEGLYGDPVSGRCVPMCLPGYYAFNDTNLCLTGCPSGYADNETRVCVLVCPAPTFADTLNNKCMRICSNGQFGQDRVCVPTCTSPLLGNPLTMECQSSCPSFDYTFAQNNTHRCVRNCSIYANSYADRNNNYCMDNCTLPDEYAVDVLAICTNLCPSGLYMENSTKKCDPGCTTGYAEPTSRYCVARCFGNPQTFAYTSTKKCIYRCKDVGLYADNSTNFCVSFSNCSRIVGPLGTYSDPISGNCVLFCPEGLYAEDTTFTCTSYCITGYADNLTRRCVSVCPVAEQTYGNPNTHTCVKVCPDNWYAKNSTQTCVPYNGCPANSWSDIRSKHCVARCPSQPVYFGYDGTTSCVTICPSTPDLYGDFVTQKCIWPCTDENGEKRFADYTTRTCVFVCPIGLGLFGDPTTGRCTSTCDPANPYKDNSTQRCVAVCPSNPDYYAHIPSKTCVRVCPLTLYASDPTTRICTSTCQPWLTFRDDTTSRCVADCPQPYFADNSTYKCVPGCPSSPDYYADRHSRTCVMVCPIGPNDANGNPQWISWIEDVNRTCVTRCPPNYFAQNSSGRCMTQCPLNQYADPIIQVCVADCTVRPGYYKQTGARTCVQVCPSTPVKAHRYQPLHLCVNMSGSVSGCLSTTYVNQLTDYCTTKCPVGYYADTHSLFCRLNCTNSQFADPYDRKCKPTCTQNPASFAYTDNMTCLNFCPPPYFSENKTYTCTTSCPNMTDGTVLYTYNVTRQCVIYCPAPYYSYVNDQTCVLGCPTGWYANDQTRTCDQSCTGTYSADDSTNRCVERCPLSPNYYSLNNVCTGWCPTPTFKDNSTRSCVLECPYLPLTFADNFTNQCVSQCPSSPNYFADNFTRTCVFQCSLGLFADPSTRTCVQSCPVGSNTFAEPGLRVCQSGCPSPNYASNLTQQCVGLCPDLPIKTYAQDVGRFCTTRCMNTLFGNNVTRKCQANCLTLAESYADTTTNLCVTTCPIGFFAYNLTSECRRDCPGLFADSTTRKCVTQCPRSQRLFADTTTGTCVYMCPVGWYADTNTSTCASSCANTTNGYVMQVQRACVVQCPPPYFGLDSQRLCVTNCGVSFYGNQVNRTCQSCPTTCITCLNPSSCLSCTANLYLQFGQCKPQCTVNSDIANYANNNTMLCGSAASCPGFTFGLNSSKACETSCPIQMYGNTTFKTCQNCPSTCLSCLNLTYCTVCANNSQLSLMDHMCYAHCSLTQRYYYGGNCVTACPNNTFFDFTQVYCYDCNALCLTCFGSSLNCTSCSGTFLYQSTCVSQCPSGYYGQSNVCVPCSSTVQSCNTPLTFKTTTTVQNYKQVIVIKFNQATTVTGDPSQFINVNLQMTRLLQDASSIINNGISFTSVVLPDGTIKLYLNTGISLDNVKYTVSFTDPSKIQTSSGANLQNLQDVIQLAKVESYPDTVTINWPLAVAGKVIAIVMLALVFAMLLFGLMPVYLLVQAAQMMSLFAYSYKLAPNLYYFLKEMRFNRFVFMPNIFTGIYKEPQGFVQSIPQKLIDTEGQLSFSINGTSYIFFLFFFIILSLIIYLVTSKINSNRPLKNLFIRIWQSRVKFTIINDFIWLFALNVFVHAFLQFRYTANSGDLALGIVSAVGMLALMAGVFGYGVKSYREDEESIKYNYGLMFEGIKDGGIQKFFVFLYYLRKILFAVIIVATIFNTLALASAMLALYSLMGLAIIVVRPYTEHLMNFVLLANECFLGFFCGGVIYYLKMIDRNQPSGAKITNGYILTIVIIIHLSLLALFSFYRSYLYLKQLRQQFKKTQFYQLYMDEQYDAVLEKQISQLNQEQNGEIQSIQITNVGANQNKQGEEQEEDQIIRLKIKRRVKKEKKQKMGNKYKDKDKEKKEMQEQSKDNRLKADYIKIQKQNQNYYKIKPSKDSEFQKLTIKPEITTNKRKGNQLADDYEQIQQLQQSKSNQWIQVQQKKQQKQQNAKKYEDVHDKDGYLEGKAGDENFKNIFADREVDESQIVDVGYENQGNQINANLNAKKQQIRENNNQKQEQANQITHPQQNQQKLPVLKNISQDPKTSRKKLLNFQFEQPEQSQIKPNPPSIVQQSKPSIIINNNNDSINNKNVEQQRQQQEQSNQNYNKLQSEVQSIKHQQPSMTQPQQKQNNNKPQRKHQQWQQQFPKVQPQRSQQIISQVHRNDQHGDKEENQNSHNNDGNQYEVFNFDQLEIENNNTEQMQKQKKQQEQKQKQKQKERQKQRQKKSKWNIDVEDLLRDQNDIKDEQERKRKQKSKKMHVMLFEDDEQEI